MDRNFSSSVAKNFFVHFVVCWILHSILYKYKESCEPPALNPNGHNPNQHGGIVESFYGNQLSRHKTGRNPHPSSSDSAFSVLLWFKCQCKPMPPDFEGRRSGYWVLQSHWHRGNPHRTPAHFSILLSWYHLLWLYDSQNGLKHLLTSMEINEWVEIICLIHVEDFQGIVNSTRERYQQEQRNFSPLLIIYQTLEVLCFFEISIFLLSPPSFGVFTRLSKTHECRR